MPTKKPKSSNRTFPRPRDKRSEPYWKNLNKVIDPELSIGVVDLGLIYDIRIQKDKSNKNAKIATIIMTLTTPTCPVGPQIISEVETEMLKNKDISKVYTEIVWEPFWSDDLMDPAIKAMIWGD